MAQPPQITTLRSEDYPALMKTSGGEVERLFRALNSELSGFASALSGALTFGDNFAAFVKTMTVTAPVATSTPIRFASSLPVQPAGILIVAARDVTNGAPQPCAVDACPAWAVSGTEIVVSAVNTLTSAHKYQLTFLVIGG